MAELNEVCAGDTLVGLTINLFIPGVGGNPPTPLVLPDGYTVTLDLKIPTTGYSRGNPTTIISQGSSTQPAQVQYALKSTDLVDGQLLGQVNVIDGSGNFARNPIPISIQVDAPI